MSRQPIPLTIGSRGSDLALWQARYVENRLTEAAQVRVIKTAGDRITHLSLHKVEGKGFFTKEIEAALLENDIDVAVHSYKDLPTEDTPGLHIAAVPVRADARDVLVYHQDKAAPHVVLGVAEGSRIGTSSLRRKAQLASCRSDLQLHDLRGNVPTRLSKVTKGELDGVVLAHAGIERLNLWGRMGEDGLAWTVLEPSQVCPAPAQGALAIQTRAGDTRAIQAVQALHDPHTDECVFTERLLLARFGGGCHLPLGAFCEAADTGLILQALVASPDGGHRCTATVTGADPEAMAAEAYDALCAQGALDYV